MNLAVTFAVSQLKEVSVTNRVKELEVLIDAIDVVGDKVEN